MQLTATLQDGLRRDPLTAITMGIIGFICVVALFGPILATYDPLSTDPSLALKPPSWQHLCGTDQGLLGIVGGITILGVVAASSRIPARAGSLVLVAAALPFAVFTWWSIVTPLLAALIVAIGWRALRRQVHSRHAR